MLSAKTEATMAETSNLSRETAISTLRDELARRAHGEISICRLAAETGLFCRGFRRYTDEQLKEAYPWLWRRNDVSTRHDLEHLADRWQIARQDVDHVATSCDVQQLEHDACNGWDDFTNEQLAQFVAQLTGRRVAVG